MQLNLLILDQLLGMAHTTNNTFMICTHLVCSIPQCARC